MNETEKNEKEIIEIDNWVVRIRKPQDLSSTRVFLMLHGYTGDENSMAIFTRNLPRNAWILAPRGPFETGEGGYKWITSMAGLLASIVEFQQAARDLFTFIPKFRSSLGIPAGPLDVFGFSQGAVVALTYAITYPQTVRRSACLSGFLPSDTTEKISGQPLKGMPIFVAHGTEDKTVPIARARLTARWLEDLGAMVTTCEAPVTHRISANCYRGFNEFFSQP